MKNIFLLCFAVLSGHIKGADKIRDLFSCGGVFEKQVAIPSLQPILGEKAYISIAVDGLYIYELDQQGKGHSGFYRYPDTYRSPASEQFKYSDLSVELPASKKKYNFNISIPLDGLRDESKGGRREKAETISAVAVTVNGAPTYAMVASSAAPEKPESRAERLLLQTIHHLPWFVASNSSYENGIDSGLQKCAKSENPNLAQEATLARMMIRSNVNMTTGEYRDRLCSAKCHVLEIRNGKDTRKAHYWTDVKIGRICKKCPMVENHLLAAGTSCEHGRSQIFHCETGKVLTDANSPAEQTAPAEGDHH